MENCLIACGTIWSESPFSSSVWELHKSCAFPPSFLSSLVDIYGIIVLHLSGWTTHSGRRLTGGRWQWVWQAGETLPCPGDSQMWDEGHFRVQSLTNAVRPSQELLVGSTEIAPVCLRCLSTALLTMLPSALTLISAGRAGGGRALQKEKRSKSSPGVLCWRHSAEGSCSAPGRAGRAEADSLWLHPQASARFPELCIPSLPLWELPAQIRVHESHWTFWSCLLNFCSIRKALNRQTRLSPGVYSGVNHPIPCQETKAPAEEELDDLILISFLI